jgi:mitochondrial fission protein ELM1
MGSPVVQPRIWALLDGRAGNDSQTLGVAQALGLSFERVPLRLGVLTRLANRVRGAGLFGLDVASKQRITSPFPDVVIATGRRLAPVALYIKKHHPSVLLVHMMHPECALDAFDVVVMPAHDHPPQRENIVVTLGAPHGVLPEVQQAADVGDTGHVAVLIGGDTKHGKFTAHDASALITALRAIAAAGKVLFISTSRRTPAHVVAALRDAFSGGDHHVYLFGNGEQNPYPAMLCGASAIVVTGDSVGMCSEACATGLPVYVYCPEKALARKHQEYIASLQEQGYVKPVSQWDNAWRGGRVLQEAQRIAPLILQKIQAKGFSILPR